MDTAADNPSRAQGAAKDLAWLLALALAYRLAFWAAMPRVLDTADAIHYLEAAKHLARGDFWTWDPKIPPLYPALTAIFLFFTKDPEWAAMGVSLIASTLAIAPLYLLARDLHGRSAAQIAGATLAIWPWMADYGCRVGNEALALFWWLLAIWFFARALRLGGWRILVCPLPFFALHLTRAEGLALWLAAPVAAALLGSRTGRPLWRRLLAFAGISLALIAANSWYVRGMTGQVTANYRIQFIVQEFDLLRFGETAYKTVFDVFPVMLGPVLLLFLGVGLFRRESSEQSPGAPASLPANASSEKAGKDAGAPGAEFSGQPSMALRATHEAMKMGGTRFCVSKDKRRWPEVVRKPDPPALKFSRQPRDVRLEIYVLLFVAAQTVASWFVLSPAPRYLMAPIAVLATWSAVGIVTVSRQAATFRVGRFLRWLPAAALVVSMLCGTFVTLASEHLGRRPREPREYKIAGQWMREHLPPGLIFTTKPQVGYYADMPSTGPASGDTLEAALRRAHQVKAQYVVADERYAAPSLRPLLDPEAAPPELHLLYRIDPFPESRVVVYELDASLGAKDGAAAKESCTSSVGTYRPVSQALGRCPRAFPEEQRATGRKVAEGAGTQYSGTANSVVLNAGDQVFRGVHSRSRSLAGRDVGSCQKGPPDACLASRTSGIACWRTVFASCLPAIQAIPLPNVPLRGCRYSPLVQRNGLGHKKMGKVLPLGLSASTYHGCLLSSRLPITEGYRVRCSARSQFGCGWPSDTMNAYARRLLCAAQKSRLCSLEQL